MTNSTRLLLVFIQNDSFPTVISGRCFPRRSKIDVYVYKVWTNFFLSCIVFQLRIIPDLKMIQFHGASFANRLEFCDKLIIESCIDLFLGNASTKSFCLLSCLSLFRSDSYLPLAYDGKRERLILSRI